MNRVLLFKWIAYDSVPIEAGRTKYDFFQASDDGADSITKKSEAEALQWLFSKQDFRKMFVESFFSPGEIVQHRFSIEYPFCSPNSMPGDIDLMLAAKDAPHKIRVFECKRVKAVSATDGTVKINNAKALKRAIKQANAYYALGFHGTYLAIILLDDGRLLPTPNTMFRYSQGAEIDAIYDPSLLHTLHEDIGIVFIKVAQTTGKSIEHAGGYGVCVDRSAKLREQLSDITNKAANYLTEYGNAN